MFRLSKLVIWGSRWGRGFRFHWAQAAYDAAAAKFEGLGGYEIEARATEVLTGLSFPKDVISYYMI